MKFIFKAKNNKGEIKEGTIDAVSQDAAVEVLQKNNLFPIRVTQESEAVSPLATLLKYFDSVSQKELVVFFRQMAILVEAKVPLLSALMAINEQTGNRYFSKVLKEITNDIEDGMPFSDALSRHKNVFSNLSISIIRAGETSGNLRKSIEYVADNIEKNYTLVSRIRSAMIYPIIVLIVFFIIGFIVVSFVLPKLTAIIKEMDVRVPWYTTAVIKTGDFMSVYWWAVLIVIMAFIGGFFYYIRTQAGRHEWDQIKIKLPIVGVIFRYVYITRFAENLGVLIAGGIPIIRALNVVGDIMNNAIYEALILKTAEEVKMGGNMSDTLKKSPLIPSMVSQMIAIGEESGQVDTVLGHIARFYDQETEMLTKNLSVLIEPVLMIIIGLAVGVMAVSVIMPIYDIANQIH